VSAEILRLPDEGILTAFLILDFLNSKNSLTSIKSAFVSLFTAAWKSNGARDIYFRESGI
jgi:hypothetical protein